MIHRGIDHFNPPIYATVKSFTPPSPLMTFSSSLIVIVSSSVEPYLIAFISGVLLHVGYTPCRLLPVSFPHSLLYCFFHIVLWTITPKIFRHCCLQLSFQLHSCFLTGFYSDSVSSLPLRTAIHLFIPPLARLGLCCSLLASIFVVNCISNCFLVHHIVQI